MGKRTVFSKLTRNERKQYLEDEVARRGGCFSCSTLEPPFVFYDDLINEVWAPDQWIRTGTLAQYDFVRPTLGGKEVLRDKSVKRLLEFFFIYCPKCFEARKNEPVRTDLLWISDYPIAKVRLSKYEIFSYV